MLFKMTFAVFLSGLFLLTGSNNAEAKDKFARGATDSSTDASLDQTSADSGTSPSTSGKKSTAKSKSKTKAETDASTGATAQKDQKVDISDLENRYWTAKDTEFSVVQNRIYTKAKRFSLTPLFGAGFNDPYESNVHVGASVDYYFSEREGVGIVAWKTTATDAKIIGNIGSNGAVPDRNLQAGYIGAYYSWIPIYAKLSLLEKRIMYFDMGVQPGLGLTFLNAATYSVPATIAIPPPGSSGQSVITGSLDIYQQLFLSEHLALKLTLVNHFYQEQIYGAQTGWSKSSQFTYSGSVLFGITYFFSGTTPTLNKN